MNTITRLFCAFCILLATGCDPVSEWLFVKTVTDEGQATATKTTLPAGRYQKQPGDKLYEVLLLGNEKVSAFYENMPAETVGLRPLGERLRQGSKMYNDHFVVIVRPAKTSTYKDLTDMLDLLTVNRIKKYHLEELK